MKHAPWQGRASLLYLLVAALVLGACAPGAGRTEGGSPALRVLSGSENRTLEPLVERFERDSGLSVEFTYKGSVDISRELEKGASTPYDAVWPASSLWITLGDTRSVIKRPRSIMRSPVVMGVKRSVAERLGWIGREVRVADLLAAAESGKLRFMMTSATQSNSGAAAYLGYLYAFSGNPQTLTAANLQDTGVRDKVKAILGRVNRTAGSSGWLKDLFLQRYDAFDAMVNYESVIIETNQELVRTNREPLYAIYPRDGLVIADSPLGYVDRGDAAKAEAFDKLQTYLLAENAQREILALGRRVGVVGLDASGASREVFNPEWGIDASRVIAPIRLPQPAVIRQALDLYQTALRKPSFTVYALDYSGSMEGEGSEDLKAAMTTLLRQQEAAKYLLQASPEDVHVVIPFNGGVIEEWEARGNRQAELDRLLGEINGLQPGGDTNIYAPVARGLEIMRERRYEGYSPAVILMTDGQSNTGHLDEIRGAIEGTGTREVPVYSIMFGEASEDQLKEIAELTVGRVFDGRANLIEGFREAKGYN